MGCSLVFGHDGAVRLRASPPVQSMLFPGK